MTKSAAMKSVNVAAVAAAALLAGCSQDGGRQLDGAAEGQVEAVEDPQGEVLTTESAPPI